MALSKKEAARLLKGLRESNKDYLIRTFSLTPLETECLFEAWKIYTKERPELLKESPIRHLDCFVHGYLAHVELTRNEKSVSASTGNSGQSVSAS